MGHTPCDYTVTARKLPTLCKANVLQKSGQLLVFKGTARNTTQRNKHKIINKGTSQKTTPQTIKLHALSFALGENASLNAITRHVTRSIQFFNIPIEKRGYKKNNKIASSRKEAKTRKPNNSEAKATKQPNQNQAPQTVKLQALSFALGETASLNAGTHFLTHFR